MFVEIKKKNVLSSRLDSAKDRINQRLITTISLESITERQEYSLTNLCAKLWSYKFSGLIIDINT